MIWNISATKMYCVTSMKKTPPEDEEKHKEHCSPKACSIICPQILRCQGVKAYHRQGAANGTDQHAGSSTNSVNIECRPCVSN
jgi:hypothetical protein